MSRNNVMPAIAVRDVNSERVGDYVRLRGWIAVPSRRPDVALFRKPDTAGGEIAIPLDRSFRDFDERLIDALEVIAAIEAVSVDNLVKRLLHPEADLVKWRRDDSAVIAGAIGLDAGIDFFDGAKRAFLASAHTVLSPSLYFARLARQDAEIYVSECLMGQTEESSFVATFYCPLRPSSTVVTEIPLPAEPFGRQVTQLVVKQFARVVEAVRVRDAELLTKASLTDVMVSGNFCEALLQMASPTVRQLGVSVDWSSSRPSTAYVVAPLLNDDFATVAEFVQQLKPKEEQKPERFIGKIGTLTASPEKDSRDAGDVTLHTATAQGAVRARVHLSAAEYEEATKAHQQGLYVEVQGVLIRKAGSAKISEPSGFRVRQDLSLLS